MEHYWGSKAILQRLGLKSFTSLQRLHVLYGLPYYPRTMPGKCRRMLYSNSELIAAWELSRAAQHREQLKAKLEAGPNPRYNAALEQPAPSMREYAPAQKVA